MSTRSIPSSSRFHLALLVLGAGLASLAAAAATDAEIGAKVRECANIDRDKTRLRCFDQALEVEEPAAVAATPAPAVAPASPAPAPAVQAQDFGSEQIERPEKEQTKVARESQRLEAVVAALDKRRDGLLTITLDNEQVWRQKSVTPLFRLRVGDSITLKKSRFGGYTLVAPGRKSTAVTRIK